MRISKLDLGTLTFLFRDGPSRQNRKICRRECPFFKLIQFGFQEGVGCLEAFFTILESINHMLEKGNKLFACFLDVRKAFDTVWIDGVLYKLFSELGIKGRMWLAIKDLYTDVKAQVLYEGVLSRKFSVSQGTGQGRIFALIVFCVSFQIIVCQSLLTGFVPPPPPPHLLMTSLHLYYILHFCRRS